MFKPYFAAKLAELGYPSDRIEYSLAYRLGDGVSFFGRIEGANIQRLADRLMLEQGVSSFSTARAVIRKAVKLGASFEIMKLSGSDAGFCDNMYIGASLPTRAPLTPYQQGVLDQFIALLRRDVLATASVLTTLGYALIDAMPPEATVRRVFLRSEFVVLVKELPDPNFDPIARFGLAQGKRIADLMTLGLFRHYGLRVEIRPRMGGEVLGEATLMGVLEDVSGGMGSGHRGSLLPLMREAASRAREGIARRRLRAA